MDNIVYLYGAKVSLAPFFVIIYAWEQRELGSMFKRRMERNNGQFDNTRWISVAKMYFQEPNKVTSNNIDTRTYVMRRGDIAFEGHSNAEYKYGRFVANDIGDGVISELFPIYMHIDDYDEAYWKYAIQIEEIMAPKLLKCIEISYTSSNKLDEDFFLKESILVPTLTEQHQIGTYFRALDHLITLHQRKCETLQKLKKSMLQKMFPKNGSHFPEIRFKGFTDAWEQREFRDLYAKSSEKNDGSIGTENNITVATMQFKPDVKVTTEDYLKTYYTFNIGDIAFEGHHSKEFKFGRFVANDIGNGIVSHIFAVFRPITEYDLNYWKYAIHNESIMQAILSRTTKASTMMHDLVTEDFLKEKIAVPSLEEQRQIGLFLDKLDHLITLHQRKPFHQKNGGKNYAKRC